MFLHLLLHRSISKTLHNTAQLQSEQIEHRSKNEQFTSYICKGNETVIYVTLTQK